MPITTQLEIANLALSHLGMRKISDLTGTDPSTIAVNDFFEICRDDLFREFKWPFATSLADLSADSSQTLAGWEYTYAYPTLSAATIWSVFDDSTADQRHEQDYEVFYDPVRASMVICSDLDDAICEYTAFVDNIALWDDKFIMALSYRLSASIAHTLTGDVDKGLKLMQLSNAYVSEAKRIGHREQKKKPPQTSSYKNAR